MRDRTGRICDCGSGKLSYWQYDARGIELCRTCSKCHRAKMKGYRAEVLTNAQYEADDLGDDEPLGHPQAGKLWPAGNGGE